MDDALNPDEAGDDDGDRVNIDYIKSQFFRTVVPNGVLGSATPQGDLQLALFSERVAIPRRIVHEVAEDGSLGPIVETIGRDAVVREVEVILTLEPELAANIRDALNNLLQLTEEPEEDRT